MILESFNEYIIVNKSKKFNNGHTHIKDYNTAIWLIKLSSHKTIPYRINSYLLESLIRISNDKKYIVELLKLRDDKK